MQVTASQASVRRQWWIVTLGRSAFPTPYLPPGECCAAPLNRCRSPPRLNWHGTALSPLWSHACSPHPLEHGFAARGDTVVVVLAARLSCLENAPDVQHDQARARIRMRRHQAVCSLLVGVKVTSRLPCTMRATVASSGTSTVGNAIS